MEPIWLRSAAWLARHSAASAWDIDSSFIPWAISHFAVSAYRTTTSSAITTIDHAGCAAMKAISPMMLSIARAIAT